MKTAGQRPALQEPGARDYGCGGAGGVAGGGGVLGAGGAAGALSPGCAPSFDGGGFSGAGAAGCSEKLKPRDAFASTVR